MTTTTDGALEVSFDNRLTEHLAAEKLCYASTWWRKLDRVVAAVLAAVGLWFVVSSGARWWSLIWFPLSVAEWFNAFSLRPLQIRYWFKRNPKFRETYRLAFEPDGIRFRTATIDTFVKWSHYTHALEDEKLFVLVYGKQMYSVVPKRAFPSEADLGRFHSLLSSRLGSQLSRAAS